MKQVLMLMGNLGAGKSTLGRMFEAEGWCRVVIDEFRPLDWDASRSARGDNVFEQEYLARNALLAAIHATKGNLVYETTTANRVHLKVLKALELKGMEVIKVRLLVSEAESLRRVTDRGGMSPFKKTHSESWNYIERKLNADWADVVIDSERMGVEEIFKSVRDAMHCVCT